MTKKNTPQIIIS